MQLIKQSESVDARKEIDFTTVDAADLQTRISSDTSISLTVRVVKPGGSSAAGGGTVTQYDATNAAGIRTYIPSTAELDTLGTYKLKITGTINGTTIEPREISFQVVALDPFATVGASVLAAVTEGSRTIKGVLRRLDAYIAGKATGLRASTAAYYAADGSTKLIEATQSTTAGTRESASTVAGD